MKIDEEQNQINKAILELLAKQAARIEKLEYEVKLLKSKHPYKSLGKGKNIETPSNGKPLFFT
jgi:hypothetical protein